MQKVRITHPATGQTTEVPEKSVPIHAKSGWVLTDGDEALADDLIDEAQDDLIEPAADWSPTHPLPGDGDDTPEPTED